MSFDAPISFQDEERYSMFLALEFRRASLHKIIKWLDFLRQECGKKVLKFLSLHIMEYHFMYDDKRLKAFESWFEWQGEFEDVDKGISFRALTKSQQVYLFYFFKEYVVGKVNASGNVDNTTFAKLIELVLNKPSSKITNSEYYKKIRKAPSCHETNVKNIEDVEIVRDLLCKFGLTEVNKTIDKAIEMERNYSN